MFDWPGGHKRRQDPSQTTSSGIELMPFNLKPRRGSSEFQFRFSKVFFSSSDFFNVSLIEG